MNHDRNQSVKKRLSDEGQYQCEHVCMIVTTYGLLVVHESIISIAWKEKYDAVVVDYHHSLHLCGERMKMSFP